MNHLEKMQKRLEAWKGRKGSGGHRPYTPHRAPASSYSPAFLEAARSTPSFEFKEMQKLRPVEPSAQRAFLLKAIRQGMSRAEVLARLAGAEGVLDYEGIQFPT